MRECELATVTDPKDWLDDLIPDYYPDELHEMIAKYVPANRISSIRVVLIDEDRATAKRRQKKGIPKPDTTEVCFYDEVLDQTWSVEFLLTAEVKAWKDAWQARMEQREERRHGPK